jgi:hypothetical protein
LSKDGKVVVSIVGEIVEGDTDSVKASIKVGERRRTPRLRDPPRFSRR